MNKLKLRLMYEEAMKRLRDAQTLSDAMPFHEISDSPYLLKLLGLELLLKIVYEHEVGQTMSGHAYDELFEKLPQDLQAKLLSLAGERIGPSSVNFHGIMTRF